MSGASAAAIAAYRNSKKKFANDQPKVKMTLKQKVAVIAILVASAIAAGVIAAN